MNITTHYHALSPAFERFKTLLPGTISVDELSLCYGGNLQYCLAVVDLDQIGTALQQAGNALSGQLLSEQEQKYFARFNYPKRQREWLGGRVAVKAAMLQLDASPCTAAEMARLTVLPDEQGRPKTPCQLSDFSISISHSSGFAIGMAGRGAACGVDIQEIDPKLGRLVDRFAAAPELDILTGSVALDSLDTLLTMLWTAKESVKKGLLHDQPSIFSGIALQGVNAVAADRYSLLCTVHGARAAAVTVQVCSPYVVAYMGDG